MTHKLINTDNYLLVVDDSVHPYDSSKVGNPLAHLPLNGSPILEGVDLLPPTDSDVDKLAKKYADFQFQDIENRKAKFNCKNDYRAGYEDACMKYKYTEDDMRKAWVYGRANYDSDNTFEQWIEKTNQYPTEFECEVETIWARNTDRNTPTKDDFDYKPKTITTAQGKQWVGKYKYNENILS